MDTHIEIEGNKQCRTCLNNIGDKYYSINENLSGLESNEDLLVVVCLQELGININTDDGNLPEKICIKCIESIKNAYTFIREAKRVNLQLQNTIRKGKPHSTTRINVNEHLDCLLESPIDLPQTYNSDIQIKKEVNNENIFSDPPVLNEAMETETFSSINELFTQETDSNEILLFKEETNNEENIEEPLYSGNDSKNWQGNNKERDKHNKNCIESTNSKTIATKQKKRGRPKTDPTSLVIKHNDRHTCDVCFKTFAWKKDLNRHQAMHTDSPKFNCIFCEKKFLRKDKLKDHLKIHDKSNNGTKQISRYTVNNQWQFADHLYTKNIITKQCVLCLKHFEKKSLLLEHMQTHLNGENINYNNEFIKELTNNTMNEEMLIKSVKADLTQGHYMKYLSLLNDNGFEMNLTDSDDDEETFIRSYQCELCSVTFQRKYKMLEHIKDKHSNDILPHKCDYCKIEFVCYDLYLKHINTQCQNMGKNYECLRCPGKFKWYKNLYQHDCIIQTNTEQFEKFIKCCLCEMKFVKLKALRDHLNEHSNHLISINKQYGQYFKRHTNGYCEETDIDIMTGISNAFASNNMNLFYSAMDSNANELYIDDSETDDEDEPHTFSFKCDLCMNSFNKRKLLQQHQATTHIDDEHSMQYQCDLCQKKFVCDALLQQHLIRNCLNSYRNYQCDKCEECFIWPNNLHLHIQFKHVISNVTKTSKKLKCETCDKQFNWTKDLVRHNRMHMPDDEKFECEFCERKFNRKDNLKSHMKVHCNKTKKEQNRCKHYKFKEIDENLCKPNGCKLIQCMICLSKHTKMTDLRAHLYTHQNQLSFKERNDSITEIAALLYPSKNIHNNELLLKQHIVDDLNENNLQPFYSITNEVGYELNISTSETDSDSDGEAPIASKTNEKKFYDCDLCGMKFERKYQIFKHQMDVHTWLEAQHICQLCDNRFVSLHLLELHTRRYCKNQYKRYNCKKCPYRFQWEENLNMHMRTSHAEHDDMKKLDVIRSLECIQCNRTFQMQKDLTLHLKIHREDEAEIKCFWCPRKFYSKEYLLIHLKRHEITTENLCTAECILKATNTSNGPKEILCKICNIKFNTIKLLREHLLQGSHHDISSLSNYSITNKLGFELQIDDSETEDDDHDDTITKYTCEMCNIKCKRKYELSIHQLDVHKFEQVPYKCNKCIFRSVSKDVLTYHLHNQCYDHEKQFQCNKCSYKFMWQENLDKHIYLLHSEAEQIVDNKILMPEQKIFKCNNCDRNYNRKDRLTAHIKKMHQTISEKSIDSTATNLELKKNDEKELYSCDICKLTYKRKDHLTAHLKKMHNSSTKKVLCDFCGRAFSSSSNFTIHMRRHTGEKPFKCDFCDMAFPRSSDLQCHRRTHTGEKPYTCSVCNKAFSRSYKLQTHMRIHTGEKPYKCTYCEKSFIQPNDLTLHIRRHTGERPYICGICGERFIQGTALKNHRIMRGHYDEIEAQLE